MASEDSRRLYGRLWVATFWPLLAIAVAVPLEQAAVQLHDRWVASRDFACLTGVQVPGPCHLAPDAAGALRTTRAWRDDLAYRPGDARAAASLDRSLDLAAVAIAPVTALLLARRYMRWASGHPGSPTA
jgi:hypothetical protein